VRVNADADPDDQREDREHERDEEPAMLLVLLDAEGHAIQCRRSTPTTGDFGSVACGRPATKEEAARSLRPLFALVCV
jgi:hypothetical protein